MIKLLKLCRQFSEVGRPTPCIRGGGDYLEEKSSVAGGNIREMGAGDSGDTITREGRNWAIWRKMVFVRRLSAAQVSPLTSRDPL